MSPNSMFQPHKGMIDILFQKLSSFKIALILVLSLCVINVIASSQKSYAAIWGFSDTPGYREALEDCGRGGANFNCSVTSHLTNTTNAANCLMTANDSNNKQNSFYCPPSLIAYNGAIPSIAMATQQFYNAPPANLALWIQDTGHSLGFLPKPVFAQGVGFSGLAPLLDIWKVFRNIAYVLLSLAIIVVGFMIMFRRKIDPQTVVSIQEALPRIIIALILITFSYAIVGLLVDLMYVTLLLAYQLFMATGAFANAGQINGTPVTIFGIEVAKQAPLLDVILSGNLVQAFFGVFPSGAPDLFTLASQFFNNGPVGAFVGGVVGGFLLNILVAVLFIRLFFLFLGAYVQIILQLIFGPMYILADVFPGGNNITNWLKNIIANLSVFVIAGLLFMLTIFFTSKASVQGSNIWVPPYTLINASPGAVSALFSIGILMMIPSIVNQFRQTIKSAGGPGMGGVFNLGPVAGMATWGYHLFTSGQYHRGQQALNEKLGQIQQQQGAGSALQQGGKSH